MDDGEFTIAAVRPLRVVVGQQADPTSSGGQGGAGGSGGQQQQEQGGHIPPPCPPTTNGRRLAATIRGQTEQRGLEGAVAQLVALQQSLVGQQATMHEAHAALAGQQASLLQALSPEGAGVVDSVPPTVLKSPPSLPLTPAAAGPAGGGSPGQLPGSGSSLRERWPPFERTGSFRESAAALRPAGSSPLLHAESIRPTAARGPGG